MPLVSVGFLLIALAEMRSGDGIRLAGLMGHLDGLQRTLIARAVVYAFAHVALDAGIGHTDFTSFGFLALVCPFCPPL